MANGNDQNATAEDRLQVLTIAEQIARMVLLLKAPLRSIAIEKAQWIMSGQEGTTHG